MTDWAVHKDRPYRIALGIREGEYRQVIIVPGGPHLTIDAPTAASAQEMCELIVAAVNQYRRGGGYDVIIRDLLETYRGVEPGDECRACGGWGRRAYSDTATWHGGTGGQAITADVCDACWGSGSRSRPGMDLRMAERDAIVRDVLETYEPEK